MDVRAVFRLWNTGGGTPATALDVAATLAFIRRHADDPEYRDVSPEVLESWALQTRRHKPLVTLHGERALYRWCNRQRTEPRMNSLREAVNWAFEDLIGGAAPAAEDQVKRLGKTYSAYAREARGWLSANLTYAQGEFARLLRA
jgi:hypothetical protein